MSLFREVELAGTDAKGKLFLHSMPGRFESIHDFVRAMGAEKIHRILCLVSNEEIGDKSPGYIEALGIEMFRRRVVEMPIEDYGVPADTERFTEAITQMIDALRAGKHVMIHCGAGVGRTGMAAICLLINMGIGVEEATRRVSDAYSDPETEDQQKFILEYCSGATGQSDD